MGDQTYTLAELAERVGLTERNVRSYATKHLVDKPARRGRRAVYTDEHVHQLEWALARFRDDGLPLGIIRRMIERGDRTGGSHPILDLYSPALTGSAAAEYLGQGEDSMPVSVAADSAAELLIYRLVRGAHRLADALGYVHAGDTVFTTGAFYRLSTWRLVEPRSAAAALAAALTQYADDSPSAASWSGGAIGRAFDHLLEAAHPLTAACVRVGPVVVVKHLTPDSGSVLFARSLAPREMVSLDSSPQVLASPAAAIKHLALPTG